MEAIVVVDMQNDFVYPEGALYVPSYKEERNFLGSDDEFVNNVARYIKEHDNDYSIYTMDYHPEDSIEFDVFPPHCVKNTAGADIIPNISALFGRNGSLVGSLVIKGTDSHIHSYSISTANKFNSLIYKMRSLDIKRVNVIGVAYDYCVGESAIAIKNQGFETTVIRDLTKSVSIKSANLTDQKLNLYGVSIGYQLY